MLQHIRLATLLCCVLSPATLQLSTLVADPCESSVQTIEWPCEDPASPCSTEDFLLVTDLPDICNSTCRLKIEFGYVSADPLCPVTACGALWCDRSHACQQTPSAYMCVGANQSNGVFAVNCSCDSQPVAVFWLENGWPPSAYCHCSMPTLRLEFSCLYCVSN